MTPPLVEVLDLTYAMLAAAQAADWTEFRYLHEHRPRQFGPDLLTHPDAPWRLPQLFAAQTELVAIRRPGIVALDEAVGLLGPICDALVKVPPVPRNPGRLMEATP